jgi:hypothetical protein
MKTKRCPKCKYNCGKRHKKTFKKRRYLNSKNKTKRGGGYGGNPYCNNPNFNIFNTNLLKLFPYKP